MRSLISTGLFLSAAVCSCFALATVPAESMAQTRVSRTLVDVRDSVSLNGTLVPSIGIPANRFRFTVDGVFSELPVSTLSQLLSGRFAGVQVLTPGATGMASRLRVRGQSSLALDNEPLIIVDGVRLFDSFRSTSRTLLSRIDDININDIATIDLLSGPAGTAMFGSNAANGVVSITTKRGTPGRTRVNVYGEGGLILDPNEYPDQWALWGRRGTNPTTLCHLSFVAAGTCAPDSLRRGSVMRNKATSPVDRGYRSRFGTQVSGGVPKLKFFVSAEREDETGVFKMPTLEVDRLKVERGASTIPDNQLRPSALTRNNLRINLNATPTNWISVDVSSAYITGDASYITGDATAANIWVSALGGAWVPTAKTSAGVPLFGYAFDPAGDIMSQSNSQTVDRFINSVSAKASPLSWVTVHGSFAKDDGTQNDQLLIRKNEGANSLGLIRNGRLNTVHLVMANATLTGSATTTFNPLTWLRSATTLGAQRIKTEFSDSSRSVFGLIADSDVPANDAVSSGHTDRVIGQSSAYFLTEDISIAKQLFVTGGFRRETPKAYGVRFDAVDHYNFGASYVLSQSAFLRGKEWLDLLRLRSAYGASAVSVGPIDFYTPSLAGETGFYSNPYFQFITQDKPEVSTEIEGGVDVALRDYTSQLSFTYYKKRTRDGFVAVPISFPSGERGLRQGALIENRGFEIAALQKLISTRALTAEIGLTASKNRNRVLKFPDGVPPAFEGNRSTLRSFPGYPAFGMWGRTYSYSDINSDGIIAPSELTISDTLEFLGSSFPTNELALSPRIEFLNHRLRISAQIDSKWGFKQFNSTLRHQCQVLGCRGATDKTASLEEQAKAAALIGPVSTLTGFIEDGSFTRLREATIAYALPARWATALRASEWNVMVTGRNLGVSTRYSGIDPEAVESSSDTHADEYFATPPMRYWVLKINLRF